MLARLGCQRTLEYDEFGRVSVMRETNGGEVLATRSGYDEYGRLKVLSYPGNGDTPGRTLMHDYGPKGELERLRWAEGDEEIWRLLDMDPAGRVTRERFGNGVESKTVYHELGAVERVTTGIPAGAGWAQKFQDLSYTYTDNGNVDSRSDLVHGNTEIFGYDELNRLTSVGSSQPTPGPATWSYDDYGNMDYHSEVGDMPAEPNGRLLSAGGEDVSYDDNGRLLSLGDELEIDYLASGQPATIHREFNDLFFEYGADGELVRREVDGIGWGETIYAGSGYQRERSSLNDYDEIEWKAFAYGRVVGIQRLRDYTQGDGDVVALQLRESFYPHADAIGSVNIASNEDVEIEEDAERSYDAWGVARATDWDSGDDPSFGAVDLGFTGHRARLDDGLIDMGARHYDPTRKRFHSPDPVVAAPLDTQSWNRYAYVRDNPLSFTDPSGLSWCPGPLCDRPGPQPPPDPGGSDPTGESSYYNSASNGEPGTEAPVGAGAIGGSMVHYLGRRALTGSWGSAGGSPGRSMLGKFAWSAAGVMAHAALHPGRAPTWFERHHDLGAGALELGVDVAESAGGFVADYYTFHAELAVGYGYEAVDHFGGLAQGAWWAANNPLEAVDATVEAAISDVENVAVQVPAAVQNVRDGDWSAAGASYHSAARSAWNTAANVAGGAKAAGELGTLAGIAKRVRQSGSTTPVGELRAAGLRDAHHVIQDAAVRDLPGYNTNLAPGVQLTGPSNVPGTPHNLTRAVQRERVGLGTASDVRWRVGR